MVRVTGQLIPNGKFPVVSETFLKGAYRSVDTKDDLNSIEDNFKKEGMLVFVTTTKELYRLENGQWVLLKDFNSDYKVKVDENDLQADVLDNKIIANEGLDKKINTSSDSHKLSLFIKDGGVTKNKLADNIDATDKHFNADMVDGKDVDDNITSDKNLWTSKKIEERIEEQKFIDLPDTPDSYSSQGGKLVVVKEDETGLEFKSADDLGLNNGGIGNGGGLFGGSDTYKVKLDDNDDNPTFLSGKIDNETIVSDGSHIKVNVNDNEATDKNLWSANKTKRTSIINAIIFG